MQGMQANHLFQPHFLVHHLLPSDNPSAKDQEDPIFLFLLAPSSLGPFLLQLAGGGFSHSLKDHKSNKYLGQRKGA